MSIKNFHFSILIPGWNAEKYIENCVKSIIENDYDNYRIILIVGGEDNSFTIAKKLEEKYNNIIISLEQELPHKNRALNKGLKYADGEIIIITDIDCVYQKNWLSKINKIFQNPKFQVVTGSFLPYSNKTSPLAEFIRINRADAILRFDNEEEIIGNKLCGANTAFRKEIFYEKIGKFEEDSITGDDKILGMQFNRKSVKVYFFHNIYIYTELHSNNFKKFIKHRIRWGRDLFISKLSYKQKVLVSLQLISGLFKFSYPPLALIISLIFFNIYYFFLFIIPWIMFYFIFMIKYYFNLKKKSENVNNSELRLSLDYKKAFRVVPLIFFIFGIISIVSLAYPKRHKWYH